MLFGGGCTVVVLRGDDAHGVAAKTQLDADVAESCRDLINAAVELSTGPGLSADAECRRVGEHRGLAGVGRGRLGDDAEQNAGAILLHLDGQGEYVERAGGEEGINGAADLLAGCVVDVGLQYDNLILE